MADFSRMKISELLRFAEEQARIERDAPPFIDVGEQERSASWAATVEILRYMKEYGVPEPLKDKDR